MWKICILGHHHIPVGLLLPRQSWGAYNGFQNHMVRVSDAKSDCSRRGEAEVRILNFKTSWSEFHHLPRVSPKQLCALAHLRCTCVAGTSYYKLKLSFCRKNNIPNISELWKLRASDVISNQEIRKIQFLWWYYSQKGWAFKIWILGFVIS